MSKLASIEKAQRITDRVFAELVPLLGPEISERKIADGIESRGRARGASGLAFPTVIGSGPKGAAPHQVPGPRKLKRGDLVVIDFGFVVDGYRSDMTRTVAIGKPSARARKVYGIVLRAQQAAIRAARPGIRARELDAVARDIIDRAGFGKHFVHTLGHGVGRKIHQAPKVGPKGAIRLKAGDVITIEPGIYLQREFGVRIEDLLIITTRGNRNLTRTPKRLLVL